MDYDSICLESHSVPSDYYCVSSKSYFETTDYYSVCTDNYAVSSESSFQRIIIPFVPVGLLSVQSEFYLVRMDCYTVLTD